MQKKQKIALCLAIQGFTTSSRRNQSSTTKIPESEHSTAYHNCHVHLGTITFTHTPSQVTPEKVACLNVRILSSLSVVSHLYHPISFRNIRILARPLALYQHQRRITLPFSLSINRLARLRPLSGKENPYRLIHPPTRTICAF